MTRKSRKSERKRLSSCVLPAPKRNKISRSAPSAPIKHLFWQETHIPRLKSPAKPDKINTTPNYLGNVGPEVSPDNVAGMEVRVVQRATDAVQARFYTVQSGDSLGAISIKFFGSIEHYTAIFEANKGLLSSPRTVFVLGNVSLFRNWTLRFYPSRRLASLADDWRCVQTQTHLHLRYKAFQAQQQRRQSAVLLLHRARR